MLVSPCQDSLTKPKKPREFRGIQLELTQDQHTPSYLVHTVHTVQLCIQHICVHTVGTSIESYRDMFFGCSIRKSMESLRFWDQKSTTVLAI